jgi:hypothetical protein
MKRYAIDEENGCEICWEVFREKFPKLSKLDNFVVEDETARKIERLIGVCTHGAPVYAQSILIRKEADE